MDSTGLCHLETQIESLLSALEDLRAENKKLRQQMARYLHEKNQWHQHNHQATVQIKKIISHLQETLV